MKPVVHWFVLRDSVTFRGVASPVPGFRAWGVHVILEITASDRTVVQFQKI